MNKEEMMKLFTETKAFLKGHFELSSGLHSDEYVQCALVLQYPQYCELLSQELAARYQNAGITCVIGPALGGVTLGYEVARALKVKGLFAERKEKVMQLRRGFTISPSDKVLVVEDVITTGGSVKEVIALVKQMGATVVGVGSIIDRSAQPVDFGVRFEALIRLPLRAFQPHECLLCKQGSTVQKPGSKSLTGA